MDNPDKPINFLANQEGSVGSLRIIDVQSQEDYDVAIKQLPIVALDDHREDQRQSVYRNELVQSVTIDQLCEAAQFSDITLINSILKVPNWGHCRVQKNYCPAYTALGRSLPWNIPISLQRLSVRRKIFLTISKAAAELPISCRKARRRGANCSVFLLSTRRLITTMSSLSLQSAWIA